MPNTSQNMGIFAKNCDQDVLDVAQFISYQLINLAFLEKMKRVSRPHLSNRQGDLRPQNCELRVAIEKVFWKIVDFKLFQQLKISFRLAIKRQIITDLFNEAKKYPCSFEICDYNRDNNAWEIFPKKGFGIQFNHFVNGSFSRISFPSQLLDPARLTELIKQAIMKNKAYVHIIKCHDIPIEKTVGPNL